MAEVQQNTEDIQAPEGVRPSDTESVAEALHREPAGTKLRPWRNAVTALVFLLAAADALISCLTVTPEAARLPLRVACGCACIGGLLFSGKLSEIEKPFRVSLVLQTALGAIFSAVGLALTAAFFFF